MGPDPARQLLRSENRKLCEEKTEKNRQKEKQAGKSRSSIARTAGLSSKRRRSARALHGCDRRFPGSKTWSLRRRLRHTGWQLLEHARLAQWDILEFSRDRKHVSPGFPEGYWPKTPGPQDEAAWAKSVQEFQHDLQEMIKLVKNPKTDLYSAIPHGQGQT